MTCRVGSLRILLQEKICVVKDARNIVYVYVCVWTLFGANWSG